MTTSTPASSELRVALDEIRLRTNVREVAENDVDALAQSIALRGLLVSVIVRPVDDGYELVAGLSPRRGVPQARPQRHRGSRARPGGLKCRQRGGINRAQAADGA